MLDLPELEYAAHHQDHQTAMADAPPFEEWCPHEGHPFLTPKFRCSQAPQVFKSLSPQFPRRKICFSRQLIITN